VSKIVLGLATSHSPMLLAKDEELPRLVERDQADMLPFRDEDGNRIKYAQVLERADPAIAAKATPEKMLERAAQCRAATKRLGEELEAANLDALIIIGDDQNEMFTAKNRPSLAIYHGDTAVNAWPPDMTGMMDWLVELRSRFYAQPSKTYPADGKLAFHIIEHMTENGFDVGSVSEYPHGAGEGHAFAYVHSYIMNDAKPIPVVPVLLNTFYRPNQVTPQRALDIGKAIRAAVEALPGDKRIGIIASGGLSHFMVDEVFDAKIIKALKEKNEKDLLSLHRKNYIDGTSETLNWICVHGAVGDMPVDWLEYVPGYRSPAGTGVGLAFAKWA
jgi:Catalytic LigB subunit of aromatic ring-opening dioxygenase.